MSRYEMSIKLQSVTRRGTDSCRIAQQRGKLQTLNMVALEMMQGGSAQISLTHPWLAVDDDPRSMQA